MGETRQAMTPKRYECILDGQRRCIDESELLRKAAEIADGILKKTYPSFKDSHEDMKQEALAAVVRGMQRYKPTGDVHGYIFKIVAYKIRDEAGKIIRYRKHVQQLTDEMADSIEAPTPPDSKDKRRYIEQLKKQLTPRERRVINMNLAGYTDKEIAGALKIKKKHRTSEMKALWNSIAAKAKRMEPQNTGGHND